MCLIDNKRFRFTFKPIKVYKVLKYDNTTPFTVTKLIKVNFTLNGIPRKCNKLLFPYTEFEKGFFHACKTQEKAEALIESLIHNMIRHRYPDYQERLQNKLFVESCKLHYKIVEGYIIGRYAVGNNNDICSRILILNL